MSAPLFFCCSEDNDLYQAVIRGGGSVRRFESADEAAAKAPAGAGVLVMAGRYPDERTAVPPSFYQQASEKGLRLYVEYPEHVPGVELGTPVQPDWERVVVASSGFSKALPKDTILVANGCTLLPTNAANPFLVSARVAGYDRAVYGIPQKSHPLLFETGDGRILVAATCLSQCVRGRYVPCGEWSAVWEEILSRLSGGQAPKLRFEPVVRPAYGPKDSLPPDCEMQSLSNAIRWYFGAQLFPTPPRLERIKELLRSDKESLEPPAPGEPDGDGRCGILEGYVSRIRHDGTQQQRLPMRADCQAEAAMVLALHSMLATDQRSSSVSGNLLRYLYEDSGMFTGPRADPAHPSFGLIAWGAYSPAWEKGYYGDDDARTILATMAAASALGTDKWDETLLRSIYANLRTTGKLGMRGDRIDMPDLERNGWKHYREAATVNLAPHFESWLWACYLWAYGQTGHEEFLETARTGIRLTMEGYPDKWRFSDSVERSRMLLPLSWLVRVDRSDQHVQWLRQVADDLLVSQVECGAIKERLAGTGGGHYVIPQTNEAFGTGECPIVQSQTDPASDQLYTTGFALLGLHEAALVTGDSKYAGAEDRLAKYLVRIQAASKHEPRLDGAWFRAFDYQRWEYWASSGDAGWGPWCLETGWGPAWACCTFALRERATSLWESTARPQLRQVLPKVLKDMARNSGGPWAGRQ